MRIALLGMHEATQSGLDSAEWDQVWGLAHDLETPMRCTAAFEAHSQQIIEAHCPEHAERLSSLAQYMPLTTAWGWTTSLGPHHSVVSYGALDHGTYIESSIAYMMAVAMQERPEAIGIFGVDMAEAEEYGYQRPNMAYLVGKAEGMGIEVTLHPLCSLFTSEWTGGCYGHPDNVDDMEYRLHGRSRHVAALVQAPAVAQGSSSAA